MRENREPGEIPGRTRHCEEEAAQYATGRWSGKACWSVNLSQETCLQKIGAAMNDGKVHDLLAECGRRISQ
ncbi:hypothetical protein SAMN05660649_04747 [Desulfotomaculum arcticum]|uniref:Uncharacterized protein n=1 Tax=Desulfotruncus arcticus DSM 17038 TaxID=1121424 RepID=A0A1I2Z4B5_9FIRM|nr:hypothetical protein SAMN05660649_04747 [Desulfotomaculum arcticum] [Desulfotruncus arcticus DSM 17038]